MPISRRAVIYSGLAIGGGLIVYSASRASRMLDTSGDGDARLKFGAMTPDSTALNAWIKIAPDGQITLGVHRAEMGQGVTTALPMMLAEELDADWDRVAFEFTPIDKDYFNFGVMSRGRPFGDTEGRFWAGAGTALLRRWFHARGDSLTLSSTSVIDAYDTLRPAGAAARAVLVEAAAQRWQVPAEELQTERSHVKHLASGRSAGYGELAEDAAELDPPSDPVLKEQSAYRIVGQDLPRLDVPAKVDGSAQFGQDVMLPGMLFGTAVHSPVVGGRIAGFDAGEAEAMPGVEAILPLGDKAVAVLAQNTWIAFKAAERIEIETAPGDQRVDSSELAPAYLETLDNPEPSLFREDGDAPGLLAESSAVTEATYEFPYLAHTCMEPMNCTALFDDGRLDVWAPSQALSTAQKVAAETAGIDREHVTMHRTLLGGGFGRRAEMDFVERAVATAIQVPGRPVKITYTREQDVQHDMYRPAAVARLKAALQDDGKILAMDYALATQSVVASFNTRTPSPRPADAAGDITVAHGAQDMVYAVPNYRMVYVPQDPGIPVGYWRSTSTSYNAFCMESFMDELAATAGEDPLEFRLRNLAEDSRHRGVLEAVAEHSNWARPMPAGRARGVALFEKARTVIAQVVEINIGDGGFLSVDRIVCVIDSGQIIHPGIVKAMMEGGMVYGLNAALFGKITIKDGRVQQSNFHDYRELPMAEIPPIKVHLLPQGGRPEGVGETAVPGIAPALANAIFAATGKRIRKLPIGQRIA